MHAVIARTLNKALLSELEKISKANVYTKKSLSELQNIRNNTVEPQNCTKQRTLFHKTFLWFVKDRKLLSSTLLAWEFHCNYKYNYFLFRYPFKAMMTKKLL